MARGFLLRDKVDARRPPIDEVGVFIKLAGEIPYVGGSSGGSGENAVDVDYGDVAIGVVEIRLAQGGVEGQLLAVGREDGAVVGRIEADDQMDLVVVSEIDDIDVFVGAEGQQGRVI